MATSKTSPTAGETKAAAEGNVPSGDVTPVISVNGAEPDQSDPKGAEVSTVADGEVPKMSELTGIRYVGVADKKSFTTEDLQALGVEDPKEPLEWADWNGKVVETSQFNAATRDALLALPDFKAV